MRTEGKRLTDAERESIAQDFEKNHGRGEVTWAGLKSDAALGFKLKNKEAGLRETRYNAIVGGGEDN